MNMAERNEREARRKADLAQIHIAKKELRLDDDNYRFILKCVAGVDSAADLDYLGRQKIIMHFRSLGWEPGRPGEQKPAEGKPKKPRKKPEGQASKVWALWYELHRLGATKSKEATALNAFCKRMTKGQCDRVEWLTAAQANIVIEGLKDWVGRVEK